MSNSDSRQPTVSIVTFHQAEIVFSAETQTIFSVLKTTTHESRVQSAAEE